MSALSLRTKLTAWYFAVLAGTFSLFSVVAYLAMETSIHATVDGELRGRARLIRGLMERHAREGLERLPHELREHSQLESEGNLFEIADAQGNWIYRSVAAGQKDVPLSSAKDGTVETLHVQGVPWRMFTTVAVVTGHPYRIQVAASIENYVEALHRFGWTMVLLAPFLLALASAGGYWMSRRALMPVDRITSTARSISGNNLSSRLEVPQTGDELQRLSETLNSMLDRLEKAFRDVIQFTADASHELRTPVAIVRTRTELALRKPRAEADYRETLGQILKEVEGMSYLLDELMFLARTDSGVASLTRARTDLVESVNNACAQGRTLAETKRVSFTAQIPSEPVWVEGDPPSLQRAFLILIDNAVKYTTPGGSVTVSLSSKNGSAVGEVRDTGIGIPAEDLPNIFKRFYRADKARSRESGGAGLGLSIGRWIVEAHGGEIEVHSTPQRGSVFRVKLPLAG